MESISNPEPASSWPGLPGLAAELSEALAAPAGAGKRERTRTQLLAAAFRVFHARGIPQATLQQVAAEAGVANGTIYNHFASREELVQGAALWVAETLCERIAASYADVPEGAVRMAIGNRRYLWLAETSPAWAAMLLDLGLAVPAAFAGIRKYPLADLRRGIRQGSFAVESEAAAMDLVAGTIAQGMRSIAQGDAPRGHAVAVTASVLRGLGMEREAARETARVELPPL